MSDEPDVPCFVIVPDSLREAINARLDEAIAKCPDAEKDREHLYAQLLGAFSRYGVIPEFAIEPTEATP